MIRALEFSLVLYSWTDDFSFPSESSIFAPKRVPIQLEKNFKSHFAILTEQQKNSAQ